MAAQPLRFLTVCCCSFGVLGATQTSQADAACSANGTVCDETRDTANLMQLSRTGKPPCPFKKKPNIILFVMDDVGWADVSYHQKAGNFPTPNIDRLATKDGVRLERFYVQPQCSPTRSAMVSGRYSWKLGAQHFNTFLPGSAAGFPEGVETIAHRFQKSGYQTHAIGKWHLGYANPTQLPPALGFDTFVGTLAGRLEFYNRTNPTCGNICLYPSNEGKESPYGPQGAALDFWRIDGEDMRLLPPKTEPPTSADYTEDLYEKRAVEILRAKAKGLTKKPVFMYFAPQLIHEPLEQPPGQYDQCASIPPPSGDELNRTALCTMMARVDEHFLTLEKTLKTSGLWEDTLIFATSDNGGMFMFGTSFPASASCNWPLRGSKATLFEGGIRVPTFVTGGALPAEARSSQVDDLMFAIDVFPTLASFAGVEVPADIDGVDQWSTIIGHRKGLAVSRELVINIGVNPMGGFPAFVDGYRPNQAPFDSLNFSSIIVWPKKLILGDPYITDPVPGVADDIYPRHGYYSCDSDGYVYHNETKRQSGVQLSIPMNKLKYPRTHGQTIGAYLFDLEVDPDEKINLLFLSAENQKAALKLVARIEHHAQRSQGWVPEQLNIPRQASNPACYDWVWQPGPWSITSCVKSKIKVSAPEVFEPGAIQMGILGGMLF